jgi:two-component system CheB/CheR fusion protein
MKQPTTRLPKKTEQDFPVVGIGASAGGLDPFKKILRGIPTDSGMAYVVVQHLSPDYDSNLTEILAQCTMIPVHEIINEINLAPNHIYIIPENNNLVTVDGILKLHKRARHERKNQTIDIFFQSLAEVHKSFAVGVLLSGTAFDGTAGLKRIKEEGGITVVQDPETASFKGMPQNAIEADTVDFICSPENIPSQLLKIQESYTINYGYSDQEHIPKSEEEILNQIINVVFLRSGNDFREYKQPTLRRRIARRMVMLRKETLLDYYHFLRTDKAEQDLLFNDFLIPVTYFFRDPHFFEALPKEVYPQLIESAVNNNLRIWVAGCSTGEEAYSLAISLHEYLSENNNLNIKIQIFASDISEKCINKARTAIYSAQDVKQVSEERLANYFTKRDGQYHINKVIRDMCVFAVHNFIKDPPFARINLVSCRNVLIYFNPPLQDKVLGSFHYSLRDKGFLLLGKSESASNVQNLFEPHGKYDKIYNRKFAPGRYVPESFKPAHVANRERAIVQPNKSQEPDFRKAASDILFSRYTPAGVIINSHLDIVHFHGDTSPFLLPSPGKPNFNILKMAREGLSFELRNSLSQARDQLELVIKSDVIIKDQSYLASFEIVPLHGEDEHLLVLFTKKPLPETDIDTKRQRKNADQNRISELENELTQLRKDIKRVTEEQQTAFEELQTTNEELLSSSEELQALNEELESSTEELQSNNEELMCVNDELIDRQEQLSSLRNYAEFIVKTISEPLIIIDPDFMIKNANPAFYNYFGTSENETEERSLFEIGNCQWNIPEFKELLVQMIRNKTTINDYKVEIDCPGIGKKMMTITAKRIDDVKPAELILLVIKDITELVTMNDMLLSKNEQLRMHNEQLQVFSSSASHDLQEPLRKINMFCKKLLDEEKELSEQGRHSLDRILFSIVNMSDLINDLIRFTKVNITESDFVTTDLNQLLKKVIHDLKDLIHETNAEISVAPLPYLNVLPFQVRQLFTNLIINSIKYAQKDIPAHIIIDTEHPSLEEIETIGGRQGTNYIKILVRDNGFGFDKEYASRIFDPFYRLHSKDQFRGSGLGLTLSKKIVLNHHGFIAAKSKINQGTEISIYLPIS